VGVAVNPGLDPIEPEIIRLEKKVAMGAKFAQSQCLYDPNVLEKFMDQISHLDIKILVGITPLLSAGMAKWMVKNCSGVIIHDEMIKRLKGAEDKVKEGIKMSVEVVSEIASMGVAGIHVMVPERADLVAETVKAIKASGVI
jgi:5,10-methylenetetrahydrofolate reductase